MKMYSVTTTKDIRLHGRQKPPMKHAIVLAESKNEAIEKFKNELSLTSEWNNYSCSEVSTDVYTIKL